MERQPSSEADLEGRLEAYFQHRAASLRAPAGLWQHVAARINAQVNEREPRSIWARLRRLLSPPWQWRPLGAAASIATLTLATIAITLAVTSPWNPDVSTLGPEREDSAMLPGQLGPRGEPGTSGLLAVDLNSNADGRWMVTTDPDAAFLAARPARSALVLADPYDQRMIVYQSILWLRVGDVDAALESLVEHTRQMDGYVVSSFRDGSDSARLTVRVPVETFDDARKTFSALALEVEREETTNEDVTEQYVDLESRLRNWQAAESQYLELLQDAKTWTSPPSPEPPLPGPREHRASPGTDATPGTYLGDSRNHHIPQPHRADPPTGVEPLQHGTLGPPLPQRLWTAAGRNRYLAGHIQPGLGPGPCNTLCSRSASTAPLAHPARQTSGSVPSGGPPDGDPSPTTPTISVGAERAAPRRLATHGAHAPAPIAP